MSESSPIVQSLGTKAPDGSSASTTGCLPPSISIGPESVSSGRTWPSSTAASARVEATSSRATASLARAMRSPDSAICATILRSAARSAASSRSRAERISLSSDASAGVRNRCEPESACLRSKSSGTRSACERGTLQVVAEHAVVADPERGDPGALALRLLERGERRAGARGKRAQPVTSASTPLRIVGWSPGSAGASSANTEVIASAISSQPPSAAAMARGGSPASPARSRRAVRRARPWASWSRCRAPALPERTRPSSRSRSGTPLSPSRAPERASIVLTKASTSSRRASASAALRSGRPRRSRRSRPPIAVRVRSRVATSETSRCRPSAKRSRLRRVW